MDIIISTEPEGLRLDDADAATIRRAAEAVAALHRLTNCELSVTVTDDAHIRALNRDYRHMDSATDVLSFALDEADEPPVLDPGRDAPHLLGDLVISLDRARAQAADFGHSLARELAFLTVHGCLHLLGYDHLEDQMRADMEAEQRRLMAAIGIGRE